MGAGALVASAGLAHPSELEPRHFTRRITADRVLTFEEVYPRLAPGELITGTDDARFAKHWHAARADSFHAAA